MIDIETTKKVLGTGVVNVERPFTVKSFDEDDGWVETTVKADKYIYRVLDIMGWKPRQLFIVDDWVDVCGDCEELETLLSASKSDANEDRELYTIVFVEKNSPLKFFKGGYWEEAVVKCHHLWFEAMTKAKKDEILEKADFNVKKGVGQILQRGKRINLEVAFLLIENDSLKKMWDSAFKEGMGVIIDECRII